MSARAATSAEPGDPAHRLTAFGLDVVCDRPLAGSHRSSDESPSGHPSTRIHSMSAADLEAAWGESGERVFEPRSPDGRTRFTVDRTARHYRLWLEDFGRYVITHDGRQIGCLPGEVAADMQERVLFAQALPVAATLQGLEVLHASAVHGRGGAAAFVGASGSGKTTLATRLVLDGAGLLTDDVLAVEVDTRVLVHPGPPFMALHRDDAALMEGGPAALGEVIGSSDKLHVARATPHRPQPLRAVYHLRRGETSQITPLGAEALHLVLGHAFVPYVMTPGRLRRHLELAELVSTDVEQFELQTPTGGLGSDTVTMVAGHLRARGLA
jgi:hypothetical protein